MSAAPAQARSPARPGPEPPRAKQTKHPATSGGPDGDQGAGRQLASSRWQRISSDVVSGHIVGASIGATRASAPRRDNEQRLAPLVPPIGAAARALWKGPSTWKAGRYCFAWESSTLRRDTAWAMSEENVETFKRAVEAYNRRDIDALLEEMDPEVEWIAAVQTLFEGEARVYRGHAGIRQWVRDIDEALADIRLEFFEIRDLGDRLVASGRFSGRGKARGGGA